MLGEQGQGFGLAGACALVVDQSVTFDIQPVTRIGAIPERCAAAIRHPEVVLDRDLMVLDPIVRGVVNDEVQLAKGMPVGLNLGIFKQNLPAEQIRKHHLVKALEIEPQAPLWRFSQQCGRRLGVLIPRGKPFQVVPRQIMGGLERGGSADQLRRRAKPREVAHRRVLEFQKAIARGTYSHVSRIP